MVDVRPVENFPETETIENIKVLSPLELIVSKVISYHSRRGKPKSGTDWRDLAVLLLRFPELKNVVLTVLKEKDVDDGVLAAWKNIERVDFQSENEDSDLIY